MLTQEQALESISINCYDAVIISQLIEKLLRHGLVTGKEVATVAGLRMKVLATVKGAIGIDLDNPVEQEKMETTNAE